MCVVRWGFTGGYPFSGKPLRGLTIRPDREHLRVKKVRLMVERGIVLNERFSWSVRTLNLL